VRDAFPEARQTARHPGAARHATLDMTGRYVKDIPEQVRIAVESMDNELCPKMEQDSKVQ
jgi:hypothetical protein